MIKPTHEKIIVSVDQSQKDTILIGGNEFKTALAFDVNYRYKAPTICKVEVGNDYLKEGEILLVHHNLLYLPSPYHLEGIFFSIPFTKILFAIIHSNGYLQPICGNIFGNRIDIPTDLEVPEEQKKQYQDRIVITQSSNPNYKEGQTILARPSSCYEIIYHINGEQKSVVKISSDMVTGYLVD